MDVSTTVDTAFFLLYAAEKDPQTGSHILAYKKTHSINESHTLKPVTVKHAETRYGSKPLNQVATSCLRMHVQYCIAFWKYLLWFQKSAAWMSTEIDLATSKTQGKTRCVNWMWQRAFNEV